MYNHDEHQSLPDDNGIAIISMSCRFPGANSIDQYWRNLIAGIESIHSKIDLNGRVHARAEIVGVEDFDFNFFNLSYKEAQLLDPQHRLLLECAWEVFEDASLHVNKGLVGVFCGAGPSSYFMNNIYPMRSQKGACGLYHAYFAHRDRSFR